MTRPIVLGLLMLAVLAPAAVAQEEVEEASRDPFWSALLFHRQEWITAADNERRTTRLRVGRRIGRGSVAVDAARVRDFSGVTTALGAETYLPLWELAEGYARVSTAPDAASVPDLLVGGEVLQHLGDRWSIGAGGWYRDYNDASIHQLHLAAGLRADRWHLRGRAGALLTDGESLPLAHVFARRFIGGAGSYGELVVGSQEEILDFLPRGDGAEPLTTPSWQATLRAQVALHERFSIVAAAGYHSLEDFDERIVAEAGLAVRW